MRLPLVLVCLLAVCCSYKMVIIGPSMSNSQIIFNARVGEALADAGHEVHLVLINFFTDLDINVKIKENVHVQIVNASVGKSMKDMENRQSKFMFKDTSFFNAEQRNMMSEAFKLFGIGCRAWIRNKEFMTWLEKENFDVAFVHMYHACPIGVVHAAKIKSWVWLNSGGLMDYVANAVGVPIIPSYVPPMVMEAHDEMTFYERTKSVIGSHLMRTVWPWVVADPETEIFREELDPKFPHLLDLAKKCPLVMVNSNELYDLPRPTLSKVVNIGGVGFQMKKPKPLEPQFQKIVDSAKKGIIIFTFGSVAPAHRMPKEWKDALLAAFKRFPEYEFLWRYKEDDLNDRLPSNVHLSSWLPQADLLQNPKTKAFISHGGYNSMQETIAAGVPLVTIALFGDQPKNSKIALKHGIAVNVNKRDVSEESIYDALKEVLENDKYSKTVKRMSAMVKKQPFGAEEKLVKWTEFLAEFKTLENLEPAGIKLNYFQYNSLDVYGLFAVVIIVVVFVAYKIVKCSCRLLCRCMGRNGKAKKD